MPAYSTDKGFTGSGSAYGGGKSTGSSGKGKDQEKKKKSGGFLKKDPSQDPDVSEREKAIARGDGGRAPDKLPPGLNPLKYSANPTPQFEGTAKNVGTLVGGIISGAYTSPLGMMAQLAGSDEVTGLSREIGDMLGIGGGFEKPMADTTSGDYDRSETLKTTAMGGNGSTQKKKPKTPKPGFTLLKGVGGTLIGT
jgi:hypothetical protein